MGNDVGEIIETTITPLGPLDQQRLRRSAYKVTATGTARVELTIRADGATYSVRCWTDTGRVRETTVQSGWKTEAGALQFGEYLWSTLTAWLRAVEPVPPRQREISCRAA